MKTSIYATLLASLVMLSTFAPTAFAQHFDNRQGNRHDYRHDKFSSRNGQFTYRQQRAYPNQNRQRVAVNNKWNWDKHNWNEQRSQLRNNWRQRNDRFSAQQQQQLDAQMRAQWLRYHNNQWNGPNNWSQYSDPNFLDYVHNNDPSLMTRIRSAIGY